MYAVKYLVLWVVGLLFEPFIEEVGKSVVHLLVSRSVSQAVRQAVSQLGSWVRWVLICLVGC
jgi:hypothetical protein